MHVDEGKNLKHVDLGHIMPSLPGPLLHNRASMPMSRMTNISVPLSHAPRRGDEYCFFTDATNHFFPASLHSCPPTLRILNRGEEEGKGGVVRRVVRGEAKLPLPSLHLSQGYSDISSSGRRVRKNRAETEKLVLPRTQGGAYLFRTNSGAYRAMQTVAQWHHLPQLLTRGILCIGPLTTEIATSRCAPQVFPLHRDKLQTGPSPRCFIPAASKLQDS